MKNFCTVIEAIVNTYLIFIVEQQKPEKKFWANGIVSFWNDLKEVIIMSPTLNAFKSELKKTCILRGLVTNIFTSID